MISINHELGASRRRRTLPSLQLRIDLDGIAPGIWRRLVIPANANLGWLHAVIQLSMGWTNSHLHQFRMGDQVITDPQFGLEQFEGDPPILDKKNVRVDELPLTKSERLVYEYDFGDSWIHVLTFEDLPKSIHGVENMAQCIDGAWACPPEDCGSIPGYADLLSALGNPKHPEHKSIKSWLGRPYDPEHFSAKKANVWLKKLKWPHVTEAALRKILIARDKEYD